MNYFQGTTSPDFFSSELLHRNCFLGTTSAEKLSRNYFLGTNFSELFSRKYFLDTTFSKILPWNYFPELPSRTTSSELLAWNYFQATTFKQPFPLNYFRGTPFSQNLKYSSIDEQWTTLTKQFFGTIFWEVLPQSQFLRSTSFKVNYQFIIRTFSQQHPGNYFWGLHRGNNFLGATLGELLPHNPDKKCTCIPNTNSVLDSMNITVRILFQV